MHQNGTEDALSMGNLFSKGCFKSSSVVFSDGVCLIELKFLFYRTLKKKIIKMLIAIF